MKRKYEYILILAICIVFLLVCFITVNLKPPINGDKKGTFNRSPCTETIFKLSFNNSTDRFIMTIGPFKNEYETPLSGLQINLTINQTTFQDYTDSNGIVIFEIEKGILLPFLGQRVTISTYHPDYKDKEIPIRIPNEYNIIS